MDPRPLSDLEREVLNWLLPADRPGYSELNQFALASWVIGSGRWGEHDLVLGDPASEIDLRAPMQSIVARGELVYPGGNISLSVHERNLDGQIEFELGGPLVPGFSNKWCYSYWVPGSPSPATGERVREIVIEPGLYTLAISSGHKTLWLHHHATKYNQLLPITGYYEAVLRAHPPENKKEAMTPRALFERMAMYSDDELKNALLAYNDEARRFDASAVTRPKAAELTFWQYLRKKIFR